MSSVSSTLLRRSSCGVAKRTNDSKIPLAASDTLQANRVCSRFREQHRRREIRVDDAALLRNGSSRWLIRDVYYAAPLPIGVQTPDRYSSEMSRHRHTIWARHGQFVLAPHVGQLAVR